MKKRDWLRDLQEGKGKEISKFFFVNFTTQEKVTKILYPNREGVEPIINKHCKKWRELGFLEKSRGIGFKDRWGRPQFRYKSIINFEPIYKYCKEYHNITFTKEEKMYLKLMFLNEKYRYLIVKEFPSDDLINAILKFYLKNCILKYHKYLRDVRENPSKYKQLEKKAREMNSPALRKRLGLSKENLGEYDVLDVITIDQSLKSPKNQLFNNYITNLSSNKQLVNSVDKKIMKSLHLH